MITHCFKPTRLLLMLSFALAKLGAQTVAAPMPVANQQFLDCRTGICLPLNGGMLYSYAAGTTTPLNTYTSSTGATPNSNPVVLNSSGFNSAGSGNAGVWIINQCYKLELQDSQGVDLWIQDNVCNQESLIQAALAASSGSSLVGFNAPSGTTRTVQAKLRESVSVLDFGADPTGAASSNTAFTNAMLSLTNGGEVLIPPGTYIVTSAISVRANIRLKGAVGASIKNTTAHGGVLLFNNVSQSGADGFAVVASNNAPVQPVNSTSGRAIAITGGSSYISITNMDISGHEFGGVYVEVASFLSIDRNYFHAGTNMSAIVGSPLANEFIAYSTMTDSKVTRNVMVSLNDIGIALSPSIANNTTAARNIISGNIIQNKYTYGILMYGDTSSLTQTVQHNIVDGNQINNIHSRVALGTPDPNSGECIYTVNSDDATISNNHCYNSMQGRLGTGTGTTLPLGAISVAAGIRNTITANHVETSAYGCYHIVSSNAYSLTNSPSGNILDANTCKDALHFGYKIDSADRTRIANSMASNFGIVDGPGIWVVNSKYVLLDNVNLGGGSTQGIVADTASDYITLSNSVVEMCGLSGYIGTPPHQTLIGNTFRNNTGSGVNISVNNGFVTLVRNTALDDRGGSALQITGFSISDSVAGCDTAIPKTCIYTFTGNMGSGNSSALWSVPLSIFSASGNQGLNDHFGDSTTVSVGGVALSAFGVAGFCATEGITSALGAGGVQLGRPTWAVDIHLADFPASNWDNFDVKPFVSGNSFGIRMCNKTAGALTPSVMFIDVGWSN